MMTTKSHGEMHFSNLENEVKGKFCGNSSTVYFREPIRSSRGQSAIVTGQSAIVTGQSANTRGQVLIQQLIQRTYATWLVKIDWSAQQSLIIKHNESDLWLLYCSKSSSITLN